MPRQWWLVAAGLCAASAALSSLGVVLQKLAWLRAEKESDSPWPFRRLWLAGLVLMGLGAVPSVLALSFASQSETAPLGSLSLAFNLWFSRVILGERMTRRDALATVLVFGGCALSVAFAAHREPVLGLDGLLALYGRPRFIVYAAAVAAALLLCTAALHGLERSKNDAIFRLHRFLYPFAGALVGAQSSLLAKSLAELFLHDAEGGGARFLQRWQPYCMLALLLCFVALHLVWFNGALARFDALYVVPVAQGAGVVFGITGGGVLYGEFEDFTASQAVAFGAGVVVVAAGLWVLSWRATGDDGDGGDVYTDDDCIIVAANDDGDEDMLSRRSSLSTALLETPATPISGAALHIDCDS